MFYHKTLPFAAIAGLLALGCLEAPAHSQTFTVDQSNTVSNGGGYDINSFAPIGQSFTPTLNGINAVEFNLNNAQATPGTVTVTLRQTNVSGTILGTSTLTTVATGAAFNRFNFASLITLIPGQVYFLQLSEAATSNVLVTGSASDTYAGGSATGQNIPGVNFGLVDLTFREGIVATAVPEPGSVALLIGMSASGAGFLVRRRRIAPKAA